MLDKSLVESQIKDYKEITNKHKAKIFVSDSCDSDFSQNSIIMEES